MERIERQLDEEEQNPNQADEEAGDQRAKPKDDTTVDNIF